MTRPATLSTLIDPDVKRAVASYCKRRGMKLRFLVERALVEQLEDEIDLEAYNQRKNEESFSLDEIVSSRKRKTRKRV